MALKSKKETDPDEVSLTELYPEKKSGEGEEEYDSAYLIRWMMQCREEARTEKFPREQQNKQNWDLYNNRHDFSHKIEGQSRESLNMQAMAVESTCSFFQQALIDEGDWWGAEAKDARMGPKLKVTPEIVHDLTQDQLEKAKMLKHVSLGTKNGLLSALIITKVHGHYKQMPSYVATAGKKLKRVTKESWQLKLDLPAFENFYRDPTGAGLYDIEDMWVDYFQVCKLAKGPDAIYDLEIVEQIEHESASEDAETELDRRRRTDQGIASHSFRKRVKLTDYWGTVLDEDGEILCENVVFTVANDKWLIRKPTSNPLWHQETPYNVCPIIDVADAVYPKALMDAPTKHNIALNEIYNLMLDGAMAAVNNIGMIRKDWLEEPSQIENGIKPGTKLAVNAQCPPGAKVLEMVKSGELPPDAQNMFNIQRQEFNASALTSDIRSGIQPKREVSATQLVETSQTITSVFKGICEQIEQNWIKPVLLKAAQTVCQFSDDIDESEVRAVLGDRADNFLKLSPEERFVETVQGIKFNVWGISQQLAKAQDFQRIATLFQTIGASQPFMEAFVKRFSVDETLLEAMKSLGINVRKIEISQEEQDMMKEQQGAPAPQGGPDQMSQVGSPTTGSLADQLGSVAGPQIPQASFPGSKATPAGGGQ